MPKNIGVFIDGTWNQPGGNANTNVRKLFEITAYPCRDSQDMQPCYYVSGVGTSIVHSHPGLRRPAEWEEFERVRSRLRGAIVPTPRWFDSMFGGAFGLGTASRIREAYAFICAHYLRGDRLFLFGFSRGALAARSLATFLFRVGILFANRLDKVEDAFRIYMAGSGGDDSELAAHLQRIGAGRMITSPEDEHAIVVHFLGVWDTVAALGLPWKFQLVSFLRQKYHDVDLPPNVFFARHALSLHEMRRAFEPLLWKDGNTNHEQVWFPGAHADVGGGYPDSESGLSTSALRWMAKEAEKYGLEICRARQWWHDPMAGQIVLHHEVRGKFAFARPVMRRALIDCARDASFGTFPMRIHGSFGSFMLRSQRLAPRTWRGAVTATLLKIDELLFRVSLESRLGSVGFINEPRWPTVTDLRRGLAIVEKSAGSLTTLSEWDYQLAWRALIVLAWYRAKAALLLFEQESIGIQQSGDSRRAARFLRLVDDLDNYAPEITSGSFGDRWRVALMPLTA